MAQDSELNGCYGDKVNRSEIIDWPSISSRRRASRIENELCVHIGVLSIKGGVLMQTFLDIAAIDLCIITSPPPF